MTRAKTTSNGSTPTTMTNPATRGWVSSVSYTHLTLPTIYSV